MIRLASVRSTQEAARDLPLGSVVVADVQTSGRGRLGRTWEAPAGTSLLASFVLPAHPLASLAAAVAAAEACGEDVRLKWPNDLMIDGRKLGGLLLEGRGDRVIAGIGINLSWAPPGAAQLGEDREILLKRLQLALSAWFQASPERVLERWRELSDTLGRRVRVELPQGPLEGVAEAIDVDGCLIVSGERVAAGDVIHLRARPAGEAPPPTGP